MYRKSEKLSREVLFRLAGDATTKVLDNYTVPPRIQSLLQVGHYEEGGDVVYEVYYMDGESHDPMVLTRTRVNPYSGEVLGVQVFGVQPD